jgi:hypothetical protein
VNCQHCFFMDFQERQHKQNDILRKDRFCTLLYCKKYKFLLDSFQLPLSDGIAVWEADPNILHGCCPEPFNKATYRLIIDKEVIINLNKRRAYEEKTKQVTYCLISGKR